MPSWVPVHGLAASLLDKLPADGQSKPAHSHHVGEQDEAPGSGRLRPAQASSGQFRRAQAGSGLAAAAIRAVNWIVQDLCVFINSDFQITRKS